MWQHEEPRIHAHIDKPKDVNILFPFWRALTPAQGLAIKYKRGCDAW